MTPVRVIQILQNTISSVTFKQEYKDKYKYKDKHK